jgi:uncharacterized protein (DUF1015 family)
VAEIRPFRGLRYNQELVGNLDAVLCPPYDVISPEQQEAYHRVHPYNVIRLEFGETLPKDDERNNRYARARAYLEEWVSQGILVLDPEPSFYVCQDEFSYRGETRLRTGLVAALRTHPYGEGMVLPHEDTLPQPKADRLRMLETCRANFSSIFALYRDEEGRVADLISPYMTAPPIATATDKEGVTHRLWRIADATTVAALCRCFENKAVFIADGHHRYETALHFSQLHGGRYGYVMTTLVEMRDPGLIVLPTHRLLRGAGPINWTALPDAFTRQSLCYPELLYRPDPLNEFLRLMAEIGAAVPCFGFYGGNDRLELIILKDRGLLSDRFSDRALMDVTLLHEVLLGPLFGISRDEVFSGRYLSYTRDPREAWQSVCKGEFQTAIFLNPPTLDQITEVAARGGRLPQKSTYFWPKLTTGLVMLLLEGIDE